MSDPRRALPSVNALLERESIRALLDGAPRADVVDAVRATIDSARTGAAAPRDDDGWARAVADTLAAARRPSLRTVINATGVVLHTNLGRAPLADAAVEAMRRVAGGYTNLEYDLERGVRGSRYVHCVSLLRALTGADDAIVVNNNAAALVLALNTVAFGRGVAISRGELVEIGGSFRIPDIMERSGARLMEVGTTNRTHPSDYASAIADGAVAIMKVHRSNFAMQGFIADVATRDLVGMARAGKIPVIDDLGSGLLLPLDDIGLSGEPTAAEAVNSGAALVTMSGDKLLGGPQAGIVLGNAAIVQRLRENPLTRAFRVDKLTLAALEATLALYRDPPRAFREIPVLSMLARPVGDLRARADALLADLGDAWRVVDSDASVGGGAFPSTVLPSVALSLAGDARAVEARLRAGEPAVVARLADDRLLVDLRAVLPSEDNVLSRALRLATGAQ